MAEIRGNIVSAWAPCGWKLTYEMGKITSIQMPPPKSSSGKSTDLSSAGRRLDFVYRDGKVAAIREGASTVLEVELESTTGEPKALAFNGKKIGIERGQRPLVQNINGQNLVGGMVSSLKRLTLADGAIKNYEFAVDDKLQPTLKMGDRLITWDPKTRMISKDNEWVYDIKQDPKNLQANAAIGRKNSKGGEFWHYDGAKGQEIVQGIDGVKTIKHWFVSGKFAGLPRKTVKLIDGKEKIVQQFTYSEAGKLIREFKNGKTMTYKYDEAGNQIEAMFDGKLMWKRQYDAQRRLVMEERDDGRKITYRYLKDNGKEKTFLSRKGYGHIYYYDADGQLVASRDLEKNKNL